MARAQLEATAVDARNDIAKRKEIAQIIMLGEFNKGEKSEGQKHVDLLQEAYPPRQGTKLS